MKLWLVQVENTTRASYVVEADSAKEATIAATNPQSSKVYAACFRTDYLPPSVQVEAIFER